MTDAEIKHVYDEAIQGRFGTVFGGLKAVAFAAAREEREACAIAVEAEALETPTDSEGDRSYDTAISHAAKAIRMRSNDEVQQQAGRRT